EDEKLRGWVAARLPAAEAEALVAQLAGDFGLYLTSSCGRLFDAVSGLAGICSRVTYEGQAAVELESAAWRWAERAGERRLGRLWAEARNFPRWGTEQPGAFPPERELAYFDYQAPSHPDEPLVFGLRSFWRRLCVLAAEGRDAGEIAYIFHLSLAAGMCEAALRLNEGEKDLLAGGGVFQNKLLTEALGRLAAENGLTLRYPRRLPPGDGGIAFGQIVTYCAEQAGGIREAPCSTSR
ncbi:MAG: hypothetical protein LBQ16_01085, partial [Gracilibacteraceae bacterium]|nr:hypothetical protein [Gracilibacteraceae bacterium]